MTNLWSNNCGKSPRKPANQQMPTAMCSISLSLTFPHWCRGVRHARHRWNQFRRQLLPQPVQLRCRRRVWQPVFNRKHWSSFPPGFRLICWRRSTLMWAQRRAICPKTAPRAGAGFTGTFAHNATSAAFIFGLSKTSPGTVFCNMCFLLLNIRLSGPFWR